MPVKIDIAMPTVHMNGDTAQTLRDDNAAAARAIDAAIDTMIRAAPNARNFYVQGDEALRRAMREHDARLKVMNRIRDEYMQIAEHASDHVK